MNQTKKSFIYSEEVALFIEELRFLVKEVLTKELGLRVFGNRFYDKKERSSYPISILLYNDQRMHGYFDSEFFELGFHANLMHTSKKQVKDIVRHELAHYITFIEHGSAIMPHGKEFQALCSRMKWGKEVSAATACLEKEEDLISVPSDVLRKVQKLMALSTSNNRHEAESAMLKSQELLLKHNIDSRSVKTNETYILKRLLEQKKIDAKLQAISKILTTFFVNVVFHKGKTKTYLEILGSPVNVEIAEYVANVLYHEFDQMWNKTNLRGVTAKNSFFLGLAKGYCNKVEALKKAHKSDVTNALLVIEKQLAHLEELAYPKLSKIKTKRRYCPKSNALGEKAGRALNINCALNSSNNSISHYLT